MSDKKKVEHDIEFGTLAVIIGLIITIVIWLDTKADERLAEEWCLKTKACVVVPVYDDDGDFDELEIKPTPSKGDMTQ
jgi:hypothetical protein